MRHIKVKQGDAVEIVPASFINKLYKFCTDDELDDVSNVEGSLYVSNAYETQINYLTDKFKNLKINVSGEYYIVIADDEARRVMANKYGDGVGITPTKAATITKLDALFTSNTNIVSFDELSEFHNLTKIADSTFKDCTNLESINIPETVTVIAPQAFDGCTKLSTEINLPNLTSLSWWVFKDTSITKVVSLGKITTLSEGVFQNCTKLESVTLPDTLQEIYKGTFTHCTSLETCDIPQSVTTINPQAFDGCTKLVGEINLPNLTSLSWGAFRNTAITKVISLGEITKLGDYTFYNCTKLTNVVLPSTLQNMYSYVFANCTELKKMVLNSVDAPTITWNTFSGTTTCQFYVPDDSVDAYKAASGWSDYADRIHPISEYTE